MVGIPAFADCRSSIAANLCLSERASNPFGQVVRPSVHPKLWAPERGVYAASLSLLSQVSLNSNLVGSFTLKRPEGRAPTNRQLLDAPRGLIAKALYRRF